MAGIPRAVPQRPPPGGPGTVSVTWQPWGCPAAKAARGGYVLVACGSPNCSDGRARPMRQPIRLPRILGHHRSACLCPSALSVSGLLLAASRRSPVIALVAFCPWPYTRTFSRPRTERGSLRNDVSRLSSNGTGECGSMAARSRRDSSHRAGWQSAQADQGAYLAVSALVRLG